MFKPIFFLFFLNSYCFSQLPVNNFDNSIKTEFIDSNLYINLSKYKIDYNLISCYPLYYKISEWLEKPYKYGGNSKNGIDCSHFVSILTKELYFTPISGSSNKIYQTSYKISKENLREGDFVFFKINNKIISHVGIYLQNDLFIHATTAKGVIISSLKDPYYQKHFFGAGRL